jgi:hypothetical protein
MFFVSIVNVAAHSAAFCDLSVQLELDQCISIITSFVYGSIKEVHSVGHTDLHT